MTLQIWGSAGQERFMSLSPSLFRITQLVVLTLNLSRASAIEDASKFLDSLKQHDVPAVINVGTKSDLPRAKDLIDEVIASFVQKTADKLKADVSYLVTSA